MRVCRDGICMKRISQRLTLAHLTNFASIRAISKSVNEIECETIRHSVYRERFSWTLRGGSGPVWRETSNRGSLMKRKRSAAVPAKSPAAGSVSRCVNIFLQIFLQVFSTNSRFLRKFT